MKNRRIKYFMSLSYAWTRKQTRSSMSVSYNDVYPPALEAAIFFIQGKEVKIYFRPLFNLCKSHSSGSQVREKRKVKAEPGSNLKFGALSCERREKPWEEDYEVQHLPVVTLRLQSQAAPYLHQEASNFWAIVQCCSMTREKSAILLPLWNCYSILSCTEMFCSKELGVPATWDFLAWGGWSLMGPWHLQVPIRTAKLIELRHFQENQGHFRLVLVLYKLALEWGSY